VSYGQHGLVLHYRLESTGFPLRVEAEVEGSAMYPSPLGRGCPYCSGCHRAQVWGKAAYGMRQRFCIR
jgi:hypothetical protein